MHLINQFSDFRKQIDILVKSNENKYLAYTEIFDSITNYLEFVMTVFVGCSIKYYIDDILLPDDKTLKKVKQIKKIITENFKSPGFGTLYQLCQQCFYLVNINSSDTPVELKKMKECLDKNIHLDLMANWFYDLSCIIELMKPAESHSPVRRYNIKDRANILKNLIPSIIEFRNDLKHARELGLLIHKNESRLNLNLENWVYSFDRIVSELSPIFANVYQFKQLTKVGQNQKVQLENIKDSLQLISEVITYNNGSKVLSNETISLKDFEETEEFKHSTSSIILQVNNNSTIIDLFPFLDIKDDKLLYYKQTSSKGYEYFSLSDNKYYLIQTKRKFNHALFQIPSVSGDKQIIFWTDVAPTINPLNNVKANIPTELLKEFVGRKKQIKKISEDIIEIPNENGLIFGPGGVGKTALMIQLSEDMFNEPDLEKLTYTNIIWVSAKKNLYDWAKDEISDEPKKFESLDNIFTVILNFFDQEDADEYSFEQKKELVIEIIQENKILLIIDNFETISNHETDAIINFFGTEVKKMLRKKADYFKVVITTREDFPCGFRPMKLEGLDLRETKLLINNLFEPYKASKNVLSEDQKKMIHEVTSGIPILIKHCIGQIFEFNKPLSSVLKNLAVPSNKVIDFSFAEIIKNLKQDITRLKIIILLDAVGIPLMIRQIVDILGINEYEIENKLPMLINFQCVEKINQGPDEKYALSSNVRLLAKRLTLEYPEIAKQVDLQTRKIFQAEIKMDFTTHERAIMSCFQDYLKRENYVQGEKYLRDEIEKLPESLYLKYSLAKFLFEKKGDSDSAIQILEKALNELKIKGKFDLNVSRLLLKCFMSCAVPPFERALPYITEIERKNKSEDIYLEIAEFYIKWSETIRLIPKSSDSLKNYERQSNYKDHAKKGLLILDSIKTIQTHYFYYLYALAFFNNWDNENALSNIEHAIEVNSKNPQYHLRYDKLRKRIEKSIERTYETESKNNRRNRNHVW